MLGQPLAHDILEAEIASLEASRAPERHKAVQAGFLACAAPLGLFEFSRRFCGMKDLGEFHKEACAASEAAPPWSLWLWARGHFKSSVLNIAENLRQAAYVWRDPAAMADSGLHVAEPETSFITTWSHGLSESFIADARKIIAAPEFKKAFWWLFPAKETATKIEFANGCNLMASTVESLPTGYHSHRITADDLVTPETVGTTDQMKKTEDRFAQLFSILNPNGHIRVIGTRYHWSDLYSGLLAAPDMWSSHIRPAINEDGVITFPERFTPEVLRRIEAQQGPYIFGCQYLLNPVPDSTQTFRPEWLRFDSPPGLGPNDGVVTLCCDPAISMNEDSCYTAITVKLSRLEADGWVHRHVLEAVRGRFGVSETTDAILSLAKRWNPVCIGIETIAYQKALAENLAQAMRRSGRWWKVHEIKSHKQSKAERIKGLQPDIAAGRYHMRANDHEWIGDEFVAFPMSNDVDTIDSLALHQALEEYNNPEFSHDIGRVMQRQAAQRGTEAVWY